MASESLCTTCLCHVACCFLRAGVRTRREHELDPRLPARVTVSRSVPTFAGVSCDTSSLEWACFVSGAAYSRGNMEGTQARPRASTRESRFPVRSLWFAGLSWP